MSEHKNPYVIDFKDVKNYFAFHNTIKEALGLPDYYGANMAALWDCLTDMIYEDKPFYIQIKGLSALSKDADDTVKTLISVLKRLKHYEDDAYIQKIKIEIVHDDYIEEIT